MGKNELWLGRGIELVDERFTTETVDASCDCGASSSIAVDRNGTAHVVYANADDGTVLMVAYMNEASFKHTLETGKATYWSRSRNELWVKGESSGNVQEVVAANVAPGDSLFPPDAMATMDKLCGVQRSLRAVLMKEGEAVTDEQTRGWKNWKSRGWVKP